MMTIDMHLTLPVNFIDAIRKVQCSISASYFAAEIDNHKLKLFVTSYIVNL